MRVLMEKGNLRKEQNFVKIVVFRLCQELEQDDIIN